MLHATLLSHVKVYLYRFHNFLMVQLQLANQNQYKKL